MLDKVMQGEFEKDSVVGNEGAQLDLRPNLLIHKLNETLINIQKRCDEYTSKKSKTPTHLDKAIEHEFFLNQQ